MDSFHDALENIIQGSSSEPLALTLEFLKAITSDFSTQLELGKGGYGVVFKGVLGSGTIIAVKKLFQIPLHINDQAFKNEVASLMGINHQNVVQFVGYCAETSLEAVTLPSGELVFSENPKRLLCFEYVCNGSLKKYITDESSGLEWNTRYNIIKGICNGLNYLHEERHLIHLDLKPGNILMDSMMTPKIADFGLSRIFGDQQSQIMTVNCAGTLGYMSPEYFQQGMVTFQADIFSLGVIMIEIITGKKDYPFDPYFLHSGEKDGSQKKETILKCFVEKVVESWKNKFASTPKYKSMEECTSEQVRECMRIALKCVYHKENRPSLKDILHVLKTLDLQMENVLDMQRRMMGPPPRAPLPRLSPRFGNRHFRPSFEDSDYVTVHLHIRDDMAELVPMDSQEEELPTRTSKHVKKLKEVAARLKEIEQEHRRSKNKRDLHELKRSPPLRATLLPRPFRDSARLPLLYTTSRSGRVGSYEGCKSVRSVLESHGVDFRELDINMHVDFANDLLRLDPPCSPPQLFVNGRHVGGAEEVARLEEEGTLGPMLAGLPRKQPYVCDLCSGLKYLPCTYCPGRNYKPSPDRIIRPCSTCDDSRRMLCFCSGG